MFNSDSTTLNNTSLFGPSTPINLNRATSSFLFSNTNTTPSLTPFLSSNLRGTIDNHKPSTLETTTFHKHGSNVAFDTINKNPLQSSHHTKSYTDLSSQALKDNAPYSSASTIITTSTTTMTQGLSSFLSDNKSSTKPAFSFGNNQPSTTSASTIALGDAPSLSMLPTTNTSNLPLDISLSKPVIASSAVTITATAPVLFSTMHRSTTSVDLQSFRTMLNTQPFNNELAFLARHNKKNTTHDDSRLCSTFDTKAHHPPTILYSNLITKPSVLSSNSVSVAKSLSTKSNTLPSKSTLTSNKRKFVDTFIDDDDYETNKSTVDDGPCSINKISKLNIKRPRMLDMNKIRSLVLGSNESHNETIFDKLSSSITSENGNGWKKFSNYEDYLSSKKRDVKHDLQLHRLPKLTHKDYYTKPTIEELRSSFNENGECFVKEFTIGRKHYGSVTFRGSRINLAGLDLDRIVEIGRRQVTVYPNEEDRPTEGEGLNCQAVISLLGVYPIDRSSDGNEEITDPDQLIDMNYGKYLEGITKKFDGEFIGYDVYTGTWAFQVEHF